MARRPLGPGGGAQPPPEPRPAPQPGGLSRYEETMFGAAIRRSREGYTQDDIDADVGRTGRALGAKKAEALRRALEGDDSLLWDKEPTNTSNPPRPRTVAAGFDGTSKTLFVRFRDGAIYEYHGVNRSEWRTFRDNVSPGRYINAGLAGKSYERLLG